MKRCPYTEISPSRRVIYLYTNRRWKTRSRFVSCRRWYNNIISCTRGSDYNESTEYIHLYRICIRLFFVIFWKIKISVDALLDLEYLGIKKKNYTPQKFNFGIIAVSQYSAVNIAREQRSTRVFRFFSYGTRSYKKISWGK